MKVCKKNDIQILIYPEDPEQLVHLVVTVHAGGEYTACGRSFDDVYLTSHGFDEEKVGIMINENKLITCPDCIAVIDFFKKSKIRCRRASAKL